MGAHLSAEFLADQFEIGPFNPFDVHHVGDKRRVHLDGKTRRQIDSEMIVGDQHDAVVRQDLHQGFADQLGIGVGKGLIGDLPYLTVGTTKGFANGIEFRAPTGDNRGRRRGRVDLSCGGRQFGRRIVGNAALVYDVGEDASHYFNPPLAFINSITLSIISSRLPCSISAPLPSAGTK